MSKNFNLFQIAETFINSKNRVKCVNKRKKRQFPISIDDFYINPFHQNQSISTLIHKGHCIHTHIHSQKTQKSALTIVPKNKKSNHSITRLSDFDQSPSEQLSTGRVQLHPHHHRPATGVAVVGFSGWSSLQHFHALCQIRGGGVGVTGEW